MQIPVTYIDIRFFVHATEDLDKVMDAVSHVLPLRYADEIVFKRNKVEGHFGNPISFFQTRIRKKEIVKAVIEKLSSNLSILEKEKLRAEIHQHLEKGSFYLRLDKQAAVQGELKLSVADPIHFHVRFGNKKPEDLIIICQRLGMLP
ncbi:MAG: RNA-binding domain-containing protein [Thermoproteota archaeon]|nr:RNA-binding domain-containing protein [Thermoproteota archaeon]